MLVFLQKRIPESGNPLLGRQSGGSGTDCRVAVPATRKAASPRGRRPPETTGADSNVDSWSVGATVTLEISESVSRSIEGNIYPLHRYAGSIEGDRKAGRVPETSIGSGRGTIGLRRARRAKLPIEIARFLFFSKADLCAAARRRDRIACHPTFYWWNVASITRPVSRAVNDNGALCVTGNNFSLERRRKRVQRSRKILLCNATWLVSNSFREWCSL